MQKQKLPPALLKAAQTFASAHAKARDETNAANRLKTELRNEIRKTWTAMELPIGSIIRCGGLEFKYEATQTTEIDAGAILDMFLNEEISREQYLRMINVSASEAKNVLGGDQVANLETTKVGNKVDVRVETLPVEFADDEFIGIKAIAPAKAKRRRVFGSGNAKVTAETQQTSRKRLIKFKGKK